MKQNVIDIAYVVSAILFIYGLKRLQSPATARKGNQLAAIGMFVAVVATLFLQEIMTPVVMIIGVVIGSGIGVYLAKRVEMTGMPELVAAFNGFGGIASALVAGAEVARLMAPNAADTGGALFDGFAAVTISLSLVIGMITFTYGRSTVRRFCGCDDIPVARDRNDNIHGQLHRLWKTVG